MPIKLGNITVKPHGISSVFLGAVRVFHKGSKNLFKTTANTTTQRGTKFEVQSDGSVICSGTATGYYSFQIGRALVNSSMGNVAVSVNGTYGAPGNIVVDGIKLLDSGGNTLASISWTTWTSSKSIDLSEYPDAYRITVAIKRNSNGEVNATIKVQVELGTSSTSWVPYEE